MRNELIICGFGGQGVIFAGELIGRAAVVSGLEAAQSASYGSEARGSACHAGVVISDEHISYPKVGKPDILIALSQTAYTKFLPNVRENGKVLFDCHLIKHQAMDGVEQIGIPAQAGALKLGRKSVANVIIVAAALATGDIIKKDALRSAILEQSPPAFQEINIKAMEAGFALAVN